MKKDDSDVKKREIRVIINERHNRGKKRHKSPRKMNKCKRCETDENNGKDATG